MRMSLPTPLFPCNPSFLPFSSLSLTLSYLGHSDDADDFVRALAECKEGVGGGGEQLRDVGREVERAEASGRRRGRVSEDGEEVHHESSGPESRGGGSASPDQRARVGFVSVEDGIGSARGAESQVREGDEAGRSHTQVGGSSLAQGAHERRHAHAGQPVHKVPHHLIVRAPSRCRGRRVTRGRRHRGPGSEP